MDAAPVPAEREEREEQSRRDLLTRYCEKRENSHLANEVLRAYEPEIAREVRPVARGLCPLRATPQDFFGATVNRARLKFIRGVCGYRGDAGAQWKAWLREVARTAALEELDFLVHRRWDVPIIEIGPESAFPGSLDGANQHEENPWDRVFRSAHHEGVMAQPLPPPNAAIEGKERESVILRLLVLRAQQSVEGEDSATTIRLRYWDGWSVIDIAKYKFGDPITAGKEKAVRRELSDDYDKLRIMLRREFGVTSLSRI